LSSGYASEAESWRSTAIVMLTLSAVVFLVQRFVATFLDPVFEACIFHIPALVASLIYLRMRQSLKAPAQHIKGK